MKKILIFYASYGGGHLSAAKSINNYLNENYPDIKTELVDCMKYINIILEKLTTSAYKEMAKKLQNFGRKFIIILKKVFFLKSVKAAIN